MRVATKEKWVLLVEDNTDHAELAARTLNKAVYYLEAVFCSDLETALETLHANRSRLPEAVFIDINLGGQDGLELVRRVKRSDILCRVRVIVLTSAADDRARTEALLAGADAFVAKPLDLRRAVNFLISGQIVWDLCDLPSNLEEYRRRRDEIPSLPASRF